MRKIILATLFVVCLASMALAQTDQITLTTYYPAPFGMYQEMRVMGKLGVGTTDPKNKLDVNGSVAIGSYAGNNVAPTNSLVVSGNVGVGTTNPAQKVDISGTSGGFLALTREDPSVASGDVIGSVLFRATDGGFDGARIEAQSAGIWSGDAETTLRFLTTNSGLTVPEERVRIESSGNVGVGTTSPAARLTVDDGSGAYSTSGNNPLGLFMTGTKNQPALSVISANAYGVSQPNLSNTALFAHGSTYAGYFESGNVYISGNVGVGTSLPNANLEVIGSLKKGPTTASTEEVLVPSNMTVSVYRNTGLCDPSLPASALTTTASCGALPAQCQLPYGHTCTQITNMGICSAMAGCYQSGPPCQGTPNCGAYTTATACANAGGGGGFCYWFPGNPGTNNTFVGRMYPTP